MEIGVQCALVAAIVLTPEIAGRQSPRLVQQSKKPRILRIDHQTSPIGTGHIIGGFYRIEITGTIIAGKSGVGEMGFESTWPTLDDFGDRVSRNKIHTKVQVRYSPINRVDPTGRGRTIYDIEFIGARPGGPKFLIVFDQKEVPSKLVIKDGKEHTATFLVPKDEDLPSAKQKRD